MIVAEPWILQCRLLETQAPWCHVLMRRATRQVTLGGRKAQVHAGMVADRNRDAPSVNVSLVQVMRSDSRTPASSPRFLHQNRRALAQNGCGAFDHACTLAFNQAPTFRAVPGSSAGLVQQQTGSPRHRHRAFAQRIGLDQGPRDAVWICRREAAATTDHSSGVAVAFFGAVCRLE